jgi:hypothetical protein
MNTRQQHLISAMDVIASFVRTFCLRRTLRSVCPEPHLNFWRVIYGNLTDLAVLEWCKLFGSDNEEHQLLHWRNLAADPKAFRANLLDALGIYESKWLSYWKVMKAYRDHSVAHYDPKRIEIKRYPDFDLALEAAYFYYGYIRTELFSYGIKQMPDDFRDYAKDFTSQCEKVATAAMGATHDIKERIF